MSHDQTPNMIKPRNDVASFPGFTLPERDKAWERGYRDDVDCACALTWLVPRPNSHPVLKLLAVRISYSKDVCM